MKVLILITVLCFGSLNAFAKSAELQPLFTETLEGGYANFWSGLQLVSPDESHSGDSQVFIRGMGKEADFEGVLSINCTNRGKSFWHYARNFSEPDSLVVPAGTIKKAVELFCK